MVTEHTAGANVCVHYIETQPSENNREPAQIYPCSPLTHLWEHIRHAASVRQH